MRNDDDDLLAAYDLSAWDVPPPAPGLADAVIARARQGAPVAALDSGERIAPRGKRRWWIASAAAAVAVVALLIGVWGVQRSPKDEQGEVTATTARSLAIGPTTAALDPGTHVRWRRDKRAISVAQPRGTVMWNVAADDTLVIDAGAMVASVEASGASLRVEVEMIRGSDARAIGISAATAVAVALVTIVVYEGTVRVRHDGQTVNVVPGAHYEVRPANVPEPFSVGAAPVDPRIAELEDKVKQLEAERDALKKTVPSQDTCDEVSCVLTNYDGACCTKFKAQTPAKVPKRAETLTRATISEGMAAVTDEIRACETDGFVGTVKVKVVVAPDGRVTTAAALASSKVPADLASCVEDLVLSAKFAKTVLGGSFSYPFVYAATAPVATCDADALRQKADDHLATGMDAAALAAFEASMRCRPDPALYKKAFLAACRSKNGSKAQVYYNRLPADDRSTLAMICTRSGVQLKTDTPAPAACDAAQLATKGDDQYATGMYAGAFVAYESSYLCKRDPLVARKAYAAACGSMREADARKYFKLVSPQQQPSLAQMCIRNGIDPGDPAAAETGAGGIKLASNPPARIYLDGVDTGKTTPATLEATAGRHKITFEIAGRDKYTFSVSVKPGETVSLTKDLR